MKSTIKDLEKGASIIERAQEDLLRYYNHKPDSFTESQAGFDTSEALDNLELLIGDLKDLITTLKEVQE